MEGSEAKRESCFYHTERSTQKFNHYTQTQSRGGGVEASGHTVHIYISVGSSALWLTPIINGKIYTDIYIPRLFASLSRALMDYALLCIHLHIFTIL